MKKLNPNEAPEGCRAVPCGWRTAPCRACVFAGAPIDECDNRRPSCYQTERRDGVAVYFVRAPEKPRAKASFARWLAGCRLPPLDYQDNPALYAAITRFARRAWNAGRRSKP